MDNIRCCVICGPFVVHKGIVICARCTLRVMSISDANVCAEFLHCRESPPLDYNQIGFILGIMLMENPNMCAEVTMAYNIPLYETLKNVYTRTMCPEFRHWINIALFAILKTGGGTWPDPENYKVAYEYEKTRQKDTAILCTSANFHELLVGLTTSLISKFPLGLPLMLLTTLCRQDRFIIVPNSISRMFSDDTPLSNVKVREGSIMWERVCSEMRLYFNHAVSIQVERPPYPYKIFDAPDIDTRRLCVHEWRRTMKLIRYVYEWITSVWHHHPIHECKCCTKPTGLTFAKLTCIEYLIPSFVICTHFKWIYSSIL